jgi:hypothetical protein
LKLRREFFYLALDRISHLLTRSVVVVLPPRPEEALQPIAALSRHHVYVQVWHGLANTIIDGDKCSFGIHSCLNGPSQ